MFAGLFHLDLLSIKVLWYIPRKQDSLRQRWPSVADGGSTVSPHLLCVRGTLYVHRNPGPLLQTTHPIGPMYKMLGQLFVKDLAAFMIHPHSKIHLYCWTCSYEMKWNESGFRPPLCTYRLNWARRTSWGWWDNWDDTVLQTQDSKFEPWRSEAEHATSRSRRLPTILTFTRGWGRNIFVSFKPPRPGTEPRTLAWKAAVLTTTLGPPPLVLMNHDAMWISEPVSGSLFLWEIVRELETLFYQWHK